MGNYNLDSIQKCSVYCIKNKINNKEYIGSTVGKPERRFRQHINNSKNKNCHHYNYPLCCAFRRYGLDNFDFNILEQKECTEREIRKIEEEYILKRNSLFPNGYNQTSNTITPLKTKEIVNKIKETKREEGNYVAEVDKNFNIIKIYRSVTDCAEENSLDSSKISDCCRGNRKSTGNRKFCYYNIKDKSLIIPKYERDKYLGEKGTTRITKCSKRVNKIDKESNKIIETYDTIALAARENNADQSSISKVCRGKQISHKGFKWSYAN